MIFSTSLPRFKVFLGDFCCKSSDLTCCILFLTPFLVPAAGRSVAAAACSVLDDCRDAGWLLRWLGGSDAPAAFLALAQRRLHEADDSRRLHILILDSTCNSLQGQCTPNTYSPRNTKRRPATSARKQKKTAKKSCHCFVFALLLTPDGLRIPFFLPFYTKGYGQAFGREHRTQTDLAAQLIDSMDLPHGVPVVVVGDTAFEAEQIRKACKRRHWRWVVPINPERRLAGVAPRPQVKSLLGQLSASDFHKVSFRLDQGDLARLARVSPKRSQSSKHQRTYWVHHRIADVHNVGKVALLFSTKLDPDTPSGVQVQKLLISNALTATPAELALWYSLRWQIELFFREMKSQLGMCAYKLGTGPFARAVNWVRLSVAAFCYLEWYRHHREQAAAAKDKGAWQRLRTHGIKEVVRRQVERADLEALIRLAADADGPARLALLLERICADHDLAEMPAA